MNSCQLLIYLLFSLQFNKQTIINGKGQNFHTRTDFYRKIILVSIKITNFNEKVENENMGLEIHFLLADFLRAF